MMSSEPDAADAARLLREQAPHLSTLEVRPSKTSGSSNWVFRIGEHLALRLPRSDAYADDLAKEVTWLPMLGAAVTTPIPRIEFTGRPSAVFPRRWAVVTWLEGRTPRDLEAPMQQALATTLGEFTAELHALDTCGEVGGAERWDYRCGEPVNDTTDGWVEEAADELSDLFDPAQVRLAWKRLREVGPAPEAGAWVHTDLSPENVLVDARGALAGVIDFGGLGVGDPAVDLLYAWDLFDAPGRAVFAHAAGADEAMWARSRAWAFAGPGLLTSGSLCAEPSDLGSFTASACPNGCRTPNARSFVRLRELTEVGPPLVRRSHRAAPASEGCCHSPHRSCRVAVDPVRHDADDLPPLGAQRRFALDVRVLLCLGVVVMIAVVLDRDLQLGVREIEPTTTPAGHHLDLRHRSRQPRKDEQHAQPRLHRRLGCPIDEPHEIPPAPRPRAERLRPCSTSSHCIHRPQAQDGIGENNGVDEAEPRKTLPNEIDRRRRRQGPAHRRHPYFDSLRTAEVPMHDQPSAAYVPMRGNADADALEGRHRQPPQLRRIEAGDTRSLPAAS